MGQIRIIFPDGLDKVFSFSKVINCIKSNNLSPNDTAYIDLQKVTFISPYGLIGLLLLSKEIYDLTGNRAIFLIKKINY